MNLSSKIIFIKKVFGIGDIDNGRLNISVKCPNCSNRENQIFKKKLVIRLDNNVYHCWVCGIKGRNLATLLKKYKKEHLKEYLTKFSKQKNFNINVKIDDVNDVELPQGFKLLSNIQYPSNYERHAIKYIYSRGLSHRDLWYFKFGISADKKYYKRIIMPSFSEDGKINYFVTRTWDKNNIIKYINCPINKQNIVFNDVNINWNNELTIVEGPFDLVKATQNSTCLLGSSLSEQSMLFQKIVQNNTNINLMLDKDANKKMFNIANKFIKYNVNVNVVTLQSDKDPGDMSKKEFIDYLDTKVLWSKHQNIMQTIDLI